MGYIDESVPHGTSEEWHQNPEIKKLASIGVVCMIYTDTSIVGYGVEERRKVEVRRQKGAKGKSTRRGGC